MTEQNNWYEKPEISGRRQFLYLILLGIGGFVLSNVFAFFLIIISPNVHLSNLKNNELPYGVSIVLQTVGTFIMFALPAIIFSKIVKTRNDYFYFKRKNPLSIWIYIVIIIVASFLSSDLFAEINKWIPLPENLELFFKKMENEFSDVAVSMINFSNIGKFILSFVVVALLPAMFEELFFRGALQQSLVKCFSSPTAAIFVTSIIFSAVHLSYYGFLVRVELGMVLGLVYYYGKNIWLNIFIHFSNNAVVLISLYSLYGSKPIPKNAMDNSSATSSYIAQIISLIVLVLAIILFVKKTKQIANHTS